MFSPKNIIYEHKHHMSDKKSSPIRAAQIIAFRIIYLLTESFRAFPALNTGAFEAAI